MYWGVMNHWGHLTCVFVYNKFSIFTSKPVFEHAQVSMLTNHTLVNIQNLLKYERSAIYRPYRSYIGHMWAIHKLYISHVQPTVQATDGPYPISRKGGAAAKPSPLIFFIYYGPSVACTVGCTWLMCSLCMAHIWPMYDLHTVSYTHLTLPTNREV